MLYQYFLYQHRVSQHFVESQHLFDHPNCIDTLIVLCQHFADIVPTLYFALSWHSISTIGVLCHDVPLYYWHYVDIACVDNKTVLLDILLQYFLFFSYLATCGDLSTRKLWILAPPHDISLNTEGSWEVWFVHAFYVVHMLVPGFSRGPILVH